MASQENNRDGNVLIYEQRKLLDCVLDTIIPSKDELPGAGEAGVSDYIEDMLTDSESLRRILLDGLINIEIACGVKHSKTFKCLSEEEQSDLLHGVESENPSFFQVLVEHTYKGYYSDPQIVRLLGLEARPPQPAGHSLAPFDSTMLENVRKRGQVYREV